MDSVLFHWGILGQKWGVRRYQYPDGRLTDAGRRRYGKGKHLDELSNEQIDSVIGRLSKELAFSTTLKSIAGQRIISAGEQRANEFMSRFGNATADNLGRAVGNAPALWAEHRYQRDVAETNYKRELAKAQQQHDWAIDTEDRQHDWAIETEKRQAKKAAIDSQRAVDDKYTEAWNQMLIDEERRNRHVWAPNAQKERK